MVTEGLTVGCTSCLEDDVSTRRPGTGSRSLNPSNGLAGIARRGSRTTSASSDQENGAGLALQTAGIRSPVSPLSPSTVETPPTSPRVAALQSGLNLNSRRDSSFGRTYDENDKKRAIPCENCALTLPRRTKEDSDANAAAFHSSGPILRTRKAFERVNVPVPVPMAGPSPPKSDFSESDDLEAETAVASQPRRDTSISRAETSSSSSSFTSNSHTHYLDYTSTHEPLAPASFSIVRQSCLRTLSCETLPPSSTQYTSPTASPFTNNPFSTGPTGSTSSGGPIFFGDALAGYTTAYIFRIPDPNARGRRRVYALMALSTHRERLAMQTFSFLSTAFRELAAWIQGLAEAELERQESRAAERSPAVSNNTPTSSFLSGRSRGPDGKVGMSLRARGLAELVGLPDFFIELHTHFVRLLVELSMLLGV
jgi:hypothetical protein